MSEKEILEKPKEIKYHKDLMDWLDERFEIGIDYDTWGAVGPDILFKTRSILGEIKREDNETAYKDAFKEIRDRTNQKFLIENFQYFFICTNKFIKIYKTETFDWEKPLENSYISFDFDKKSKNSFLDFIDNNCQKICIDAHLPEVLDWMLSDKIKIETDDILKIICNIGTAPTYLNKGILFNPGMGDKELLVEFKDSNTVKTLRSELIEKYYIRDLNYFKDYIKHNYSSHLKDTKKSNLGKYYTPPKLVNLIAKMVSKYINDATFVLDLCCGCGAFLETFNDCKIIGRDIDPAAIYILDFLGFENIEIDNTLSNIKRDKYNLTKNDEVVIIGNPPYNDIYSHSKKHGLQKKTKCEIEIDSDIKTRDLGRTFLNAYVKLNPKAICVLHPLSYLIKKVNFNSLKKLKENYKLIDAIIFSNREFLDLTGQPFPVVAALYIKDKTGMNYEYIKNFKFKILDSIDIFQLSKFEMITTKYMKKSASTNVRKSDINLYNYNIRDINSVIARGNLEYSEEPKADFLTVDYKELHKYCYINMMKYFFPNNYLFGNLEPLFEEDRLENDSWLKDLMIMGTFLWQKDRLPIFDYRKNKKECLLYTKMIINQYRKKSKNTTIKDNIYKIFVDIVDNYNDNREQEIYDRISNYFYELTAPYFPNTKF